MVADENSGVVSVTYKSLLMTAPQLRACTSPNTTCDVVSSGLFC